MKTPAESRFSLLLLAVVILTLSPLLFCDFTTWDDDSTVSRNSKLNPPSLAGAAYYWTHQAGSLYIPVTYTLWSALAVAARLSQRDAFGIALNPMVFHGANLLVHAGSAALVLSILTRLTKRPSAALIGALLYAIHPVQVEAVAWVSGLKDVLWGFFSLAAIDLYLQIFLPVKGQAGSLLAGASADSPDTSASSAMSAVDPLLMPSEVRAGAQYPRPRARVAIRQPLPWLNPARYAGATLCVALAMLSKPTAMVTPAIVVAIDALLLRRPWKKIAKSAGPWLLLIIPCAIIARVVQPGAAVDGGPLWARPLITLDSLTFYFGKLLWPATLTPDYGHRPPAVIASGALYWTWIVPLIVFAIAAWQFKRRPWITAGLAVFILGTLPTLGFIPFSFQFFSTTADHYLYVSMLGVAIIAAYALAERPLKRPAIIACAVILLALAGRSFMQTFIWTDDTALLKQMDTMNPKAFIAPYMIGQLEVDAGHYLAAEPYLRRSIAMEPRYPRPHDALSVVLMKTGREKEAIEHIQAFISGVPNLLPAIRDRIGEAHVNLGIFYSQHNDLPRAIKEFQEALKLRPGDPAITAMLKKCETVMKSSQ